MQAVFPRSALGQLLVVDVIETFVKSETAASSNQTYRWFRVICLKQERCSSINGHLHCQYVV